MNRIISLRDKQGFSLIELLVVLSTLSVIMLLTIPIPFSFLTKQSEEKILEQFQYDVLYLQNQALGTNNEIRMTFHTDGYTISDIYQNHIQRQLPEGWEINPRNMKYLSFNKHGSIRYAGTIQINTTVNQYKIIFPLGKGRGYIEKH